MIEPELQALVLELAGIYKWLRYHTHDSRKSHRGFPDLQLLRVEPLPRLLVIELKGDTDYGRQGPTDEQRRWLDYFSALGSPVEVYVWYPRDWPEIQRILSPNWRPTPTTEEGTCPSSRSVTPSSPREPALRPRS